MRSVWSVPESRCACCRGRRADIGLFKLFKAFASRFQAFANTPLLASLLQRLGTAPTL